MSADSNDIALIGKLFEREDQWRQRVDDALALGARLDAVEKALDPATFGSFANSVTGLLESIQSQLATLIAQGQQSTAALTQQLNEHTAPLAEAVKSLGE